MWPRLRTRRALGPAHRRTRGSMPAFAAALTAGLTAAAVLGTPQPSSLAATAPAEVPSWDVDFPAGLQPGETRLVSSPEVPPDEEGQPVSGRLVAGAPAISDDGRVVAQQAFNQDGESESPPFARIYRRDLASGERTVHGDRFYDSTVPSLDGDGDTVAYQSQRDEIQRSGSLGDIDVFVDRWTDFGEGEGFLTEQVTGTTGDLTYQRQVGCDPRLVEESWSESSRCGPQLSTDGRAVAFESFLSPASSTLSTTVEGEPSGSALGGSVQLVDFGDQAALRTIVVRAGGGLPVQLTRPTVRGTGFFLEEALTGPPPCVEVTLEAGESCYVQVGFTRSGECTTRTGRLLIGSPTPRGRTELALVADDLSGCPGSGSGRPGRAAAGLAGGVARGEAGGVAGGANGQVVNPGCPVPSAQATGPAVPLPDDQSSLRVHDLGGRSVGTSMLVAQNILNYGNPARLTFAAEGCGVVMLAPGDRSDLENACTPGAVLEFAQSCTAYLAFTPGAVRSYAASLRLRPVCCGSERLFRYWGAGVRSGVVVRRDGDGDGSFTGTADPPARLVNRGPAGGAVDADSFALAGNGRYVAFTSTLNGRLDEARLFRHDTDRAGDGTFAPGATVSVPMSAPDGGGPPSRVAQPSISGDGTRLAFTRVRFGGEELIPTQVEVADLRQRRAVVVSTPGASPAGGDRDSLAPAISRDGSTVTYVSSATLESVPAERFGDWVFVRDLAPDLAGTGTPGNEIVSLTTVTEESDGTAGLPAVNRDGAVVTFLSPDRLTEDGGSGFAQIYARSRYGDPVVSPAAVTFPTGQVRVTGPTREVSVQNLGPGPLAVSEVVTGPFAIGASCEGAVVHRGETCTAGVALATPVPGPQEGALTWTMGSVAWEGTEAVVPLMGTAVPTLLLVSPDETGFEEQLVGVPSAPVRMTATNAGSVPMSVVVRTVPVTPPAELLPDPDAAGDDPADDPAADPDDEPPEDPEPALPEEETEFLLLPVGERPDVLVPDLTALPEDEDEEAPDPTEDEAAPGGPNGPDDPNDPDAPPPPEPEVLPDCDELPPGGSCSFLAFWRPTQLQPRAATVEVVGSVEETEYPEQAALTGLVLAPLVEYSPTVVRDGRVVFVSGEGFLPGQPLQLTWDTGIVAGPVVVPDEAGAFEAPLVMVKGRGPGLRQLVISMPGVPGSEIDAPPLLVVPGTAQPPDWGVRN